MSSAWVGKPCPKCKHVRTANEVAPDWQCPACGIAYAKYQQSQSMQATNPGTRMSGGAVPPAPAASGEGSTGAAMFAHLCIPIGMVVPFLSLLGPIIVWAMQSGKNEFAVSAAKESLNFQITMTLWGLVLVGLAVAGMGSPAMLIVTVCLVVVFIIALLILPIIAAVKV